MLVGSFGNAVGVQRLASTLSGARHAFASTPDAMLLLLQVCSTMLSVLLATLVQSTKNDLTQPCSLHASIQLQREQHSGATLCHMQQRAPRRATSQARSTAHRC